jgi:arylsulfatase A-like enzyme
MSVKKPHILLFNPDQWRGDVLGHLGNPAAQTPNLDRLVASEAVSFRNTFCQNPVCVPSRCSFMTGWYPHTLGHRTMSHMLQPHEPNLLKRLKQAGYFVWWGGKNHLVAAQHGYESHCDIKYEAVETPDRPFHPNPHAYNEWRGDPDGEDYYSFYYGSIEPQTPPAPDELGVYDRDWAMVAGALEFIRNWSGDQPLCIYLPLFYPHPPYAVEEPWFSQIDREALPDRIPAPADWTGLPSLLRGLHQRQGLETWTEAKWTELRATYYGMCSRVDAQFGMVLDALKEKQIYDDTAVAFFSDHGDFTGDFGLVEKTQNTFQDSLVRVPFILKPPAGQPIVPGVRDALVELLDLVATVEELAGLERGYSHFSRSLMPLLNGGKDAHREAVFSEGGRLKGEAQAMELESSQSKDFLYWPRMQLQAQDDGPEHTKATMIRTDRYKYVHRLYESDEFYDLETDPSELHNRSRDPAFAQVITELRSRLMDFYLETADVVPTALDPWI